MTPVVLVEHPIPEDDPLMRPQVLAAQRAAEELRVQAEEAADAAAWWAGLVHHGHDSGDCCDRPDCYQAWEMYPDG